MYYNHRRKNINKKTKSIVYEKAKNRCELKFNCCLVDKRLQIHHVDKNPLNNDLTNLLLVCRTCHDKVHARRKIVRIRRHKEEIFNQCEWCKKVYKYTKNSGGKFCSKNCSFEYAGRNKELNKKLTREKNKILYSLKIKTDVEFMKKMRNIQREHYIKRQERRKKDPKFDEYCKMMNRLNVQRHRSKKSI